jgi:hypothetical protein
VSVEEQSDAEGVVPRLTPTPAEELTDMKGSTPPSGW